MTSLRFESTRLVAPNEANLRVYNLCERRLMHSGSGIRQDVTLPSDKTNDGKKKKTPQNFSLRRSTKLRKKLVNRYRRLFKFYFANKNHAVMGGGDERAHTVSKIMPVIARNSEVLLSIKTLPIANLYTFGTKYLHSDARCTMVRNLETV